MRPRSGADPEWAARPLATTRIVPAALRRTTTASVPSAVVSPASKHRQASQPAKRSTCTNGALPPLLVADEQQHDLGVGVRALGERAQGPEGEHDAALHVDGARADQPVAVAGQRLVVVVRDDRVEVAEQQDPA